MRTIALAALLVTLMLSADAEAARRRGSGESERAARAEARSRAALVQVCRGCGLASDVRPSRRNGNITVPNLAPRPRWRAATLYPMIMPSPLTSRTEWYIRGSNRMQAQQLQSLQFQQQMQFELNQLRGELHRHDLFR
jgi:hypothetical protein